MSTTFHDTDIDIGVSVDVVECSLNISLTSDPVLCVTAPRVDTFTPPNELLLAIRIALHCSDARHRTAPHCSARGIVLIAQAVFLLELGHTDIGIDTQTHKARLQIMT